MVDDIKGTMATNFFLQCLVWTLWGKKFHESDNAALEGSIEKAMQSLSLEGFRRKTSTILNFKLVKICIDFHSIAKNLI